MDVHLWMYRDSPKGYGGIQCCLDEKKRWLACLDGGEERLAAFLVLQERSCAVVAGAGVAGGGEKKGRVRLP